MEKEEVKRQELLKTMSHTQRRKHRAACFAAASRSLDGAFSTGGLSSPARSRLEGEGKSVFQPWKGKEPDDVVLENLSIPFSERLQN